MRKMTALEYLKEKNRMTEKCCIGCDNCPFSSEKNTTGLECGDLQVEYPEIAISIVQKWAEGNPKKTMLQDFLERFPKAVLNKDGVPMFCPDQLGYQCDKCGEPNMDCVKCWNRPMEVEE